MLSFNKQSGGAHAANGKEAGDKQGEDPAKARLSRRGARLAFEKLSSKFGPRLLKAVPKMWQAMAGGLLSACATGEPYVMLEKVELHSNERLQTLWRRWMSR